MRRVVAEVTLLTLLTLIVLPTLYAMFANRFDPVAKHVDI